ncbi:hypothetical protein [Lysinibacillus fusiformis]|uniref:hypothetical protein n=1 Tax=Lysinibacillus fusiformis TaxID=28031 RepID=UPI00263AE48B|nr:hypothetical protein [Lysinibacillus fusiformis]MDC6266378.1 hypothetical protein [Lysinibacillus sphaericus]MDN4970252.1 hypothetical protein [Lysinibacillus fusiformis]
MSTISSMKKILLLLILGISITLLPNFVQGVKAEELDSESNTSQIFDEFINSFFNDTSKVNVTNSVGLDYTKEFLSATENLYTQNNLQEIKRFIVDNKLLLSYGTETEKVGSTELNLQAGTLNNVKSASGTQSFYHIGYDAKGKYQKEWITYVTGSYTYNTTTYQIVSAQNPTISLSANFGAAFAPYMDNVSTSASISGGTVTFKASYSMLSGVVLPILDYGVGQTLNYGNQTDQFKAYAGTIN